MDNRPIGIFDSGVGGLTVLRALQERLPDESTIYVGDLARCPYGVRPHAEVSRFAVQIGDLLASEGIKLLVIACNTATAAAFDVLWERYSFPVIGVISPGARAAVRASRTGRIGVVATDATVASSAYRSAILTERPNAMVIERSASWLVPIIERGSLAHSTVADRLLPVMSDMREADIDVLILGCTHFPLVSDVFELGAGPTIQVVDSATTTAQETADVLRDMNLQSDRSRFHRFLVTGSRAAFAQRAQAMFRSSPPIETVDLALDAVL